MADVKYRAPNSFQAIPMGYLHEAQRFIARSATGGRFFSGVSIMDGYALNIDPETQEPYGKHYYTIYPDQIYINVKVDGKEYTDKLGDIAHSDTIYERGWVILVSPADYQRYLEDLNRRSKSTEERKREAAIDGAKLDLEKAEKLVADARAILSGLSTN